MKKNIQIKRVYETASSTDGSRILVDRLWPRGIKKTELCMDAWIKELAPSHELREWFNHDPKKFKEFKIRYAKELDDNKTIWFPLIKTHLKNTITLLYAAHDPEINHARCLQDYLKHHSLK